MLNAPLAVGVRLCLERGWPSAGVRGVEVRFEDLGGTGLRSNRAGEGGSSLFLPVISRLHAFSFGWHGKLLGEHQGFPRGCWIFPKDLGKAATGRAARIPEIRTADGSGFGSRSWVRRGTATTARSSFRTIRS